MRSLTWHEKDSVAVIEIFDPIDEQKKIAQLTNELLDLCSQIKSNHDIRVIVLSSVSEKGFAMTEDIFPDMTTLNEGTGTKVLSISQPIAMLEQPVVAAINGDAIGLGLGLALACDVRICSELSHFAFPFLKKGYTLRNGGTQRLPRLVGRSKALELILTAEVIDAQEANSIGLVNKVVPSGQLMTVAMNMAQKMVAMGPVALRFTKEAIHKGMDLTLNQGLRLEADLYFLLHTTRDRTEGIKAFKNKRSPRFKGK